MKITTNAVLLSLVQLMIRSLINLWVDKNIYGTMNSSPWMEKISVEQKMKRKYMLSSFLYIQPPNDYSTDETFVGAVYKCVESKSKRSWNTPAKRCVGLLLFFSIKMLSTICSTIWDGSQTSLENCGQMKVCGDRHLSWTPYYVSIRGNN